MLPASRRLGFTPDGPDLLSGFVLSVLSISEYCTKFGKLIVTKIIKTVATKCQKCSQFDFDFGWGSAPVLAGGAYSAPSDPLFGWERAGCPLPINSALASALPVSILRPPWL